MHPALHMVFLHKLAGLATLSLPAAGPSNQTKLLPVITSLHICKLLTACWWPGGLIRPLTALGVCAVEVLVQSSGSDVDLGLENGI